MYGVIKPNFVLADNDKFQVVDIPSDWATDNKGVHTRVVEIEPGMEIYPSDNTEEACIKLANDLEEHLIKTRVGRNCEVELWSVYIISVPDEIGGE